MSAEVILTDLIQRGVQLQADGSNLVVDAPQGVLTAEVCQTLKTYKPELLRMLTAGGKKAKAEEADFWRVTHEDGRVFIHSGGFSRDEIISFATRDYGPVAECVPVAELDAKPQESSEVIRKACERVIDPEVYRSNLTHEGFITHQVTCQCSSSGADRPLGHTQEATTASEGLARLAALGTWGTRASQRTDGGRTEHHRTAAVGVQ